MRVLKFVAAVALLAAVVPATAHAQYSGKFQWVGTGNSFVATYKQSNLNNISVYGGAGYQAQLNIVGAPASAYLPLHGTGSAFGPTVDIFCVDFAHHAQSAYNAWFTKLDLTTPLTKTRSSNLADYLKAAWLVQKMETFGPISTAANQSARADIHAAIWYMMAGSPISVQHGLSFTNAGMNTWILAANTNYLDGSVHGNEWTVVTDACVATGGTAGQGFNAADSCSQEFLTRNVVPEPATLILLGTGLLATLAMTGVLRRPPTA